MQTTRSLRTLRPLMRFSVNTEPSMLSPKLGHYQHRLRRCGTHLLTCSSERAVFLPDDVDPQDFTCLLVQPVNVLLTEMFLE